jgi:hypothetical protein
MTTNGLLSDDKALIKSLTSSLNSIFSEELKNEYELEQKYKLKLTEAEKKYMNFLQDKYKYLKKKGSKQYFPAIRKICAFGFKNYFFFRTKNSYEEYNYAKEFRRSFFKMVAKSFFEVGLYTAIFYSWMRMIKHKGSADNLILFLFTAMMALGSINYNSYYLLNTISFPLSPKDITVRQIFVEELVFECNRSTTILEEIKYLSKIMDNDRKYTFDFITPLTSSHLEVIIYKGRLFINSDNFGKLLGIRNIDKVEKPRITNFNIYNSKERDIIFCLLKVYQLLLDEYISKNNINMIANINPQTDAMNKLIRENKISEQQINLMKRISKENIIGYDKIYKDIEFHKIEQNKKI